MCPTHPLLQIDTIITSSARALSSFGPDIAINNQERGMSIGAQAVRKAYCRENGNSGYDDRRAGWL